MKWKIHGKTRFSPERRYAINWEAPSKSKLAQKIKDYLLYKYGHYQWYEEFRIPGTLLRVDFLCPALRLAIECDGRQHFSYVKHFHKNRAGYLRSIQRDELKENLLRDNGFRLIRVSECDKLDF